MGRRAQIKVQETDMFSFDRFTRVATAAVGALILSTLAVGAAVGPAQAASAQHIRVVNG